MAQQFDIVGNLLLKVDGAEAGLNKLKSSLSKLKMPEGLENSFKKSFSNLDGILARYRAQVEKGFDTKADVTAFSKTSKALDVELTRISKHFTELTGKEVNFRVKSDDIIRAEKELQALIEQKNQLAKESLNFKIEGGSKGVQEIESLLKKLKEVAGNTKTGEYASNALDFLKTGNIQAAITQLDKASASCKRFKKDKQEAFQDTGFDMSSAITAIVTALTGAESKFSDVNTKITDTQNKLSNFHAEQVQKAGQYAEDLADKFAKDDSAIRKADGAMQEYAHSVQSMAQQLGDLQQSTQYFFSLRNMINLFKRGIDDAIQSVKELDKAMTDTAVVTDYKVSDMWNMLPQYTKIANELGATTQGAYETMTLYFQQGLDQQQAFELGAETMKMARIAGLDYAETTDMMTAALRGFNMELNETSARRINDVYSKLAAVTASDTEELGTAMQRTASIAHSAGMSFEGTTAFLAQAIETTREPAENIGTAMKTIIARFQEMKKNPLEISEVEGEEVDFNKVDAALKTIGVDLKDTNGQFRELDKVFLDISERWDGLSQTQQRYIATTAAGSRQQSRFIAMMDNYERTIELVNAANNSAGASNEQFNKTMDSLEAKINKLHNAWQAFTMGIANNGMIKLAVDGVTNLLTVTNKLIDTLSLGSGVLKSFLSIFLAFNGLKATGKAANALIGGLGGMVDPQSSFSAGFRGGVIGKNSAQAINQPIVKELQNIHSLIAQKINQTDLGKGSVVGPYDEYNRFKQARANLAGLSGENTVKDLTKQLVGLSGKNQNLLMRGNAAKFQAATNSLISSYGIKHLREVKAGERFLNDQRKSAQITAEEYYAALQDPGLLKQAMRQAGVQQNNPAYTYMNELDEIVGIRAKQLQAQAVSQGKHKAAQAGKNTPEILGKIERGFATDKAQEYFRQKALAEFGMGSGGTKANISKMGALLDGIGSIGTGIAQAGMGIQAFGSILISSANPALQAFGSALTSVGGLISGLGMGISGIGQAFTAISGSKLITNIAGTGTIFGGLMTAAGALTGGLLLLGGVIAALVIGIKKHNDNIKKAAEEVGTTYKEKNEKAQTNISNLQSWREDFARLSSGVDENGYNVSLSTEDYDRYLEITRGIAEINPAIVESYNAQGQAIITNNKALEETLELEKQHQQEAFSDYISDDSLRKIIAARDLEKRAKTIDKESTISQWGVQTKTKITVATDEVEFKPQATMRKQAQKIGKTLQDGIKEGWVTEDLLEEDFNISISKLAEGDEETLKKFDQFGPKIQQRINDSMDYAGDNLKESTKNTMLKAFSGYSDAADELDELITPTYEYLMASTSRYATAIPSEFKKYFNQGLKEIAADANITNVDAAAEDFTNQFTALTEKGGDYYQLLQDATKAQDEYAKTLNADAYNDFIEGADGARARIEALKQSLEENNMDLTQGYGKAIAEFLDNQLHQMENFTQSGAANLQYALNTMVDQIAAAEGALENFNKIAEGSTYGKAAKNMSQIFETATADEHILGEGDQAFWAGAEAMVGRKNLLENGEVTKESALKQMKEVQEMLKGGQEGWDNFKIKWFDSVEAMGGKLVDENGEIIEGVTYQGNGWIDEIDENINPEVYEQIANALDMSKDSLIAMLNLGRQFGEISFTNVEEVRKALATSDSTIKNTENGKVFVRQEDLESEMTRAGVDLNEQQQIESDLQKNYNVDFIKAAKDITESNQQFTEMGIDSMNSLVKTFDATGKFNKEEIAEYAKAYADVNNLDNWENAFNEAWNQNETNQEFGGIPDSLTTIQSILTSIDGHLANQRLANGYLDEATAGNAKQWLYGGKGEDTAAQHFWKGHGSGQNGEITTSEFNKTSKELTDFIQKGTDYVAKLDEAKQAALDRGDSSEAVKIEAERLAYEQMLKNATKYLTEGTETYNNQIQTKLDGLQKDSDLVNQGFEDLFSSITPESINTDEAQSALNELYEAAISNTPTVLTDSLKTQMDNLGVDIQKAIDAGLVVDDNDILGKAKKAGEKGKKDADDSYVDGQSSGKTETSKSKQSGKNAAEKQDKERAAGQAEASPQPVSTTTLPPAATKAETKDSKITVQAEVDEPALEKAKTLMTEIQALANEGATFNITVKNNGLKNAAKQAAKITKTPNDKSISITATATGKEDTEALTKAVKDFRALSNKTISLTASASGTAGIYSAISAVKEFYKLTNDSVTVTTIHKNEYPGKAKGANNYGYYSYPTLTGSAARGNYGQLGPKGKGGLTLTGELGYEIAWLPDENRSMILGANGPQMLNLPGNAVVWDHEQSKKILSQKAIPAGSHYTKGKEAEDPRKKKEIVVPKPKPNPNPKPKPDPKPDPKPEEKEIKKKKKTLGKMSAWWDNINRKLDSTGKKIEKTQKLVEGSLKDIRSTTSTVKTQITKLKNDYAQSIKLNNNIIKRSTKAIKGQGYKSDRRIQVSYEVYNKKKKKKETTKPVIDANNYVKYDKKTDSYIVDDKKINRVATTKGKYNRSKADAYKGAAEQFIKNIIDPMIKAGEDNLKAYEAMRQAEIDSINYFHGYKNELNKEYNLNQHQAANEHKANMASIEVDKAQFKIDHINLDLLDNKALDKLFDGLIETTKAQGDVLKQQQKTSKQQSENYDSTIADLIQFGLKGRTVEEQEEFNELKSKGKEGRTKKEQERYEELLALNRFKTISPELSKEEEQEFEKLKKKGKKKRTKKEQKRYEELLNRSKGALTEEERKDLEDLENKIKKGQKLTAKQQKKYNNLKSRDWNQLSEPDKNLYIASRAVRDYLDTNTGEIKYSDLERDYNKGKIGKDLYDGLKEWFDTYEDYKNKGYSAKEAAAQADLDIKENEAKVKDLEVQKQNQKVLNKATELNKKHADILEHTTATARNFGYTLEALERATEKASKQMDKIFSKEYVTDTILKGSFSNFIKTSEEERKQAKRNLDKELANQASLDANDKSKGYQVTYEYTDKEGRTRTGSQTLGKFVVYNSNTKQLEWDTKALEKIPKLEKDAFIEASSILIETNQENINKARDEYDKVIEGQDNAIKQMVDSLWNYNNELTRTYILGSKIATLEKQASLHSTKTKQTESMVAAGFRRRGQVQGTYNIQKQTERNDIVSRINYNREQKRLKQQEKADLMNTKKIDTQITQLAKLRSRLSQDNPLYKVYTEEISRLSDRKNLSRGILSEYFDNAGNLTKTADYIQSQYNAGNLSESEYRTLKEIYDESQRITQEIIDLDTTIESSKTALLDDYSTTRKNLVDQISEYTDYAVQARQNQIDVLTTLNDSINNGFNDLISTVRTNIEKRRQAEDNAKTKDDLSKQQRYLSMLRSQTGKGNAGEIARVSQELKEGQKNYQRTLEDQAINSLQERSDEAAKQRERQISIMTLQLEWQQKTGILAQRVEDMLLNPTKYSQELSSLYKIGNDYASKSSLGKEELDTSLDVNLLQATEAVAAFADLKAKIKNIFGFATGGLANFTGPAWLDGTPSKPELVLNATDTHNFLILRDVLSNTMKTLNSNNSSDVGGENATYEININVDHLNNDYDVDKVAERVKKIIVKDSSYRNVTQVRNFR